jgi:hypothetical protein
MIPCPMGLCASTVALAAVEARPSPLPIRWVRGRSSGHRDRIFTAIHGPLPPEGDYAASSGHRTLPLMKLTRDHFVFRRQGSTTPLSALDRCVKSEGAASLTAQATRLGWPQWTKTTDPALRSSSRGGRAADLAGTPCGMGNPRERVQRSAWGRLQHMTEAEASQATWGRSRFAETSTQALSVRTWGRTAGAHLSTWNPAGDVPNRTSG